jgi:cysteinyl-tRNA synthetase
MRIYNTLSGQKEDFVAGDPVKIYVCGITPYSECHIGHAMSYILFDVIRRYLEFCGHRIQYVQNFTDIDDKIIARANQAGLSTQELAEGFIADYFTDMDSLNIKRADVYPRATEEIPNIIEVIAGLIDKGHAYPAGGDVYFRVSSFPEYGKLSHRNLDEMMAGTSCEVKSEKEHTIDFTLWKAAKPDEPWWSSPWGPGRPGWHIECSAMSLKYLGDTLDIHGGGQDLIFPHHENEIAQSEAFAGVSPFVKYWLHNGLLQLGDEKMSKSLGNLITVKEALERFSSDAIRLFILSSHYRSPLTFSEDGQEAAERGVERLRLAAHRQCGDSPPAPGATVYRERFTEAMDDDFNTAQAIASLFDLASEINRSADEGHSTKEAQSVLTELAGVLGFTLESRKPTVDISSSIVELAGQFGVYVGTDEPQKDTSDIMELLIAKRTEYRQTREWALADKIRAQLAELGIVLEDTSAGTTWRYNR